MSAAVPFWRRPGPLLALLKGLAHKYLSKVPTGHTTRTGKTRYRYIYRATARLGRGLAHDDDMQVGAAFRVDGGHYHVIARNGATVKVKHDEGGETRTMTLAQLRDVVHEHHRDALKEVGHRAAQDVHAARLHGTAKQRARAEAYHANIVRAFGGMMEWFAKIPAGGDAFHEAHAPKGHAQRRRVRDALALLEGSRTLEGAGSYDDKGRLNLSPSDLAALHIVQRHYGDLAGFAVGANWTEHDADARAWLKSLFTKTLGTDGADDATGLWKEGAGAFDGPVDRWAARSISRAVRALRSFVDFDLARDDLAIDRQRPLEGRAALAIERIIADARTAYYKDARGTRTAWEFLKNNLPQVRTQAGLVALKTLTSTSYKSGLVPAAAISELLGYTNLTRAEKGDEAAAHLRIVGTEPVGVLERAIEADKQLIRTTQVTAMERHHWDHRVAEATSAVNALLQPLYLGRDAQPFEAQTGIIDHHFTALKAEHSKVKQLFSERFGVQVVLDDDAYAAFATPAVGVRMGGSRDSDKEQSARWNRLSKVNFGADSVNIVPTVDKKASPAAKAAFNELNEASQSSTEARTATLRGVWHALEHFEKAAGFTKLDLSGLPLVISDRWVTAGANAHYQPTNSPTDVDRETMGKRKLQADTRSSIGPHIAINMGFEKSLGHELLHYIENRIAVRVQHQQVGNVSGTMTRLSPPHVRASAKVHRDLGLPHGPAGSTPDLLAAEHAMIKASTETRNHQYIGNMASWLVRHAGDAEFQTPDGRRLHDATEAEVAGVAGGKELLSFHRAVKATGGYERFKDKDAQGDVLRKLMTELGGDTYDASDERNAYYQMGTEVLARGVEQYLHQQLADTGVVAPTLTHVSYSGGAQSAYFDPTEFREKIAPHVKAVLAVFGDNLTKGARLLATLVKAGLAQVPHYAPHRPPMGPATKRRRKCPFVGTVDFQGLTVDVENARGSYREGVAEDGTAWRTLMRWDYGEIRGAGGMDGDALDAYIGPDHDSPLVVVVHQKDPATGKPDEDKVFLGWRTAVAAVAAYKRQYDAPGFYGGHVTMSIGRFKRLAMDPAREGKRIGRRAHAGAGTVAKAGPLATAFGVCNRLWT